jgi:exosortase/archaeosortase
LIGGAISTRHTPTDISLLALVLAVCLAASVLLWRGTSRLVVRLSAYLMVIYISYAGKVTPDWLNSIEFAAWIGSIFSALAVLIALAPRDKFRLSTLDLLIVLAAIAALWIPIPGLDHQMTVHVLVRCIIFLYACEVLLEMRGTPIGPVGLASGISLLVLAAQLWL